MTRYRLDESCCFSDRDMQVLAYLQVVKFIRLVHESRALRCTASGSEHVNRLVTPRVQSVSGY